jgi:3-hydroxymyristoyl/3-hydroxydecanoyl-(acyl carrier protein) dehydratase
MSDSAPQRLALRDDGGARELTLRVPEQHACFEGHFPGRPIVPGVELLHWAVCALADWQQRELDVCALEALKFRRPLLPGETFSLRLAPASDALCFAFEMRDANGPIASGRVRVLP